MIKNLPENAQELSSDHEIYKIILEEGNKKNRLSNLNDTCVGVCYIINTYDQEKNEVIDFTKDDKPAAWIIGDRESECDIYLFLQVAIRTMCEGETAKIFFTKKYLLGDAPFVNEGGKIINANVYTAIVKLIKATALDQISLTSESLEKNSKQEANKVQDPNEPILDDSNSNNANQIEAQVENELNSNNNKKEDLKEPIEPHEISNNNKIVEIPNDEAFQRRKFALNQLKLAESLLQAKKPAAARKEFNRAKMSWSTQVDLSKAPETITHEALDLPEDELKKYVNSRAQYGVARTFLEIEPPNTEKAVINLQECIELDPDFFEAKMMLESLGQKVDDNQFPEFEDKRLTKQQYWMKPDVEWSKREEYSNYIKDKAKTLFDENNYKEALDLYKRCIISFSGQSKCKGSLSKEQISTMNKINIISKLNCLACYLLLKEYPKVVVHADELFDTILKMEPSIIDENIKNNQDSNNSANEDASNSVTLTTADNENDINTKVENKTCNEYKLKCLYRKALAYIAMQMSDNVELTINQMKGIQGSNIIIQAIRKKQQDDAKLHQKDQDIMYSKMINSMKT